MMNTGLFGALVTVAFAVAFVGITLWTLWPRNRERLKAHALIPLNDEESRDER